MNNEGNNKIPNTKETVKDNPQIKITEPTIFRIKTKYVGTTTMVLTWYKHFTRNGGLNQSKIRNLYTIYKSALCWNIRLVFPSGQLFNI